MPLECCICTDVLVSTQIKVSSTPCGHVYHTPCIFDWINKCENGANCPVCRRTFQSSEVVPLDVVTDEDITAIAKAIAEQVTLKKANEENQQPMLQVNPFSEPERSYRYLIQMHPLRAILPDYNLIDSSDEYYDEEPLDEVSDAQPVELSFDEGNRENSEEEALSEGNVSDVQDDELSIDEGTSQSSQEELLSEGNSQSSNDLESNSIDQNDYGLSEQEELNDSIHDFSIGNASDVHDPELSFDEGSREYYDEEQLSEGNVSDAQDVELSFEDCDQSEHWDIDNDDQTSADIEHWDIDNDDQTSADIEHWDIDNDDQTSADIEHWDIDNDDQTSADIEHNDFAEVDDDIYDQNDFDDNYSNHSYGGNDDFDDYD